MLQLAWKPNESFLIGSAILSAWFAALLVAIYRRQVRVVGLLAALVSVIACALLLAAAAAGQSLYPALMLLYSCLSLGAMLVLPRRDCGPDTIGGILFMLGSTLLAYSTENLLILLAAWILSTLPFLVPRWFLAGTWRPRVALLLSDFALGVAIALINPNVWARSIPNLRGSSPGGIAVFGLLIAAVIFRKGILPVHAWVADAAEGGPVTPTALLLNSHFGALLVAKVIVPLFPGTSGNLFPILSYLAIATSLYVGIRALTENSPRRLLAFIALSQSAAILAGLESRTAEGITGALVHWFVVTVSTVGLFAILRLLEVRFGENLTASKHLGLAEHAPRLAVSFAVFGLALVGLPGTLSFCSQDLLIHGTLMSHPLIGLLLPIATAMNAVSIFRLFTRLFLGRHRTGFTVMADALPRERWILAAGMLFVVLGGLFPKAIVAQCSAKMDVSGQAIHTPPPSSVLAHSQKSLSTFGRDRTSSPGIDGSIGLASNLDSTTCRGNKSPASLNPTLTASLHRSTHEGEARTPESPPHGQLRSTRRPKPA
jgi:NADH-quinone oxidoreductase subunit M